MNIESIVAKNRIDLLTKDNFDGWLEKGVWQKGSYNGNQPVYHIYVVSGPANTAAIVASPQYRKKHGLRARAYRLGPKRKWSDGLPPSAMRQLLTR